jgi:hypothetical protein
MPSPGMTAIRRRRASVIASDRLPRPSYAAAAAFWSCRGSSCAVSTVSAARAARAADADDTRAASWPRDARRIYRWYAEDGVGGMLFMVLAA